MENQQDGGQSKPRYMDTSAGQSEMTSKRNSAGQMGLDRSGLHSNKGSQRTNNNFSALGLTSQNMTQYQQYLV